MSRLTTKQRRAARIRRFITRSMHEGPEGDGIWFIDAIDICQARLSVEEIGRRGWFGCVNHHAMQSEPFRWRSPWMPVHRVRDAQVITPEEVAERLLKAMHSGNELVRVWWES